MIDPIWVDDTDAFDIHEYILSLDGGASGIRDSNLLHSALARPRQHFAYATSPDIIDLAATLTTGIVKNHPFVDGNKRTGFLLGIMFLELNGLRFTASEDDATQMVLDLAASAIDEAAYAAFLRASTTPSALSQTPPPGA
jgi:death-on-curing protein